MEATSSSSSSSGLTMSSESSYEDCEGVRTVWESAEVEGVMEVAVVGLWRMWASVKAVWAARKGMSDMVAVDDTGRASIEDIWVIVRLSLSREWSRFD